MNWTRNARTRAVFAGLALALSFSVQLPAQAVAGYLATPNGIAGAAQTLAVSLPGSASSTATITASTPGASLTLNAPLNSQGVGSIQWTPSTSGIWTLTSSNAPVTTQVSVIPTPTVTSIHTPGQLQLGISASSTLSFVKAILGSASPQGIVTLKTQQGAVLATSALQPTTEAGLSSTTLTWTPSLAGVYPIVANFTPAGPSMSSSTSALEQPQIVGGTPMVSFRFAPALRVGVTASISAVTGVGIGAGSVGFLFDGVAPRGSVATFNGVAETTWAPPTPGLHLLRAEFTGNSPSVSGIALQQINALPAAVPDSINVVLGASVVKPAGLNSLAIGTSQVLSGQAQSGSPLLFGASGSCVIAANRLLAISAGQCTLTAQSFGSDAYSAVTISYPIVTAPLTIAR